MEYSAIWHSADKKYCFALEKGKILIRLKTKKGDMSEVILHFRYKYIPTNMFDTRQQVKMSLAASDRFNDYYEAVIDVDAICVRYFFELTDTNGVKMFYCNHQFIENFTDDCDRMYDCPQNLREEEMFNIPAWAKNKVVYQIFPSRFATSKDVPKDVWYKKPMHYRDDLQGDLRGIINHLDHINKLGIEVIYMTPIFYSLSCHKYDTIDYYKIDPSFGTEDDLRELVEKAHALGIKVILDAVFNHSGTNFFAFEDVLKNQEKSKYLDWYFIDKFPVKYERGKMERPNYLTFGYFGGMPKLNLKNEETAKYFLEVGKYWIREFNVDGWRLDVGDEVSHVFWKKFRKAIKEVKEDALIIGEIWHYAGDFLEGDEWDSVMNYPFYYAVIDFVAAGTSTPSQFLGDLGFLRGNLHPDSYSCLLNLIDSHDTPRFMHQCKNKKKKHRLGAALQILSPGMPMIYYGDEFAMEGAHDPDCRRGMLWDEEYQDKKMFEWYCKLIQLRKEHPCVTDGDMILNESDDDKGLLIYTKRYDDDELTFIFHNNNESVEIDAHVGEMNLLNGKKFDGAVKGYDVIVLKK